MTIEKLIKMKLVDDVTEIYVRGGADGFEVLAHGNWMHDNVIEYLNAELESFTWQDDGVLYADIQQEGA